MRAIATSLFAALALTGGVAYAASTTVGDPDPLPYQDVGAPSVVSAAGAGMDQRRVLFAGGGNSDDGAATMLAGSDGPDDAGQTMLAGSGGSDDPSQTMLAGRDGSDDSGQTMLGLGGDSGDVGTTMLATGSDDGSTSIGLTRLALIKRVGELVRENIGERRAQCRGPFGAIGAFKAVLRLAP